MSGTALEARRGRRQKFNKATQVIAATAAAASSLALGATAAWAASSTWTGNAGDGLWQTPTNWNNGSPGATSGTTNTDIATFNGSPPADNVTVTIDAGRNVGGLLFNNSSGSTSSWVLGSAGVNGGNPLILTNGGTIQLATISPTAQFTNTINSPLVLAGSSYSIVNNGTDLSNLSGLRVTGSITPGSAAPVTTLTLDGTQGGSGSSGSELAGVISDGNLGGKLSIVKNGTGTWRMFQGSGMSANTYSGDTIVNAGILRTISGTFGDGTGGFSANSHYVIRNGATIRNGVIGSTMRSLEIDFGGALVPTTSSTNTLNLASNSEPAIQLNFGSAVGTTVQAYSMPYTFTGTTPTAIKLIGNRLGDGTGSPGADFGATTSPFNLGPMARIFDIGQGATANTYDARIRGPISGTGGIIKQGLGILRLDNASQGYSGTLEVDAGEVRVSSANPFSQSVKIVIKSGGTLSVGASATGILNLNVDNGPALLLDYAAGPGNAVSAPFSFTGSTAGQGGITLTAGASTGSIDLGGTTSPIDFGSVARNINVGAGNAPAGYDLRIRGPISGSAQLTKLGAGILRFDNGANPFTGTLEVAAGTLDITGSNTMTGNPALLVDGGNLHVFGDATQTFGSVTVTKGGTVASNTASTIASPTFSFNVAAADSAAIATALADSGGPSTLTMSGGSGSATLSGALSYTGATTVSAGTLSLATSLTRSSSVTVSGGKIELRVTGDPTRVLVAPNLTVSGTGKIDIKHNHLITNNAVGSATAGVYSGVSGLIQKGRNGGGWGGNGIVTSMSDAVAGNFTSIGLATAQQVKGLTNATDTAVFSGQTVTGNQTLVMYTYGGDANLDGKINVDDYGKIDSSAPLGIAGWFNGDFNYDGKINVDDYGIIDFNIGIQGAQFPSAGAAGGGSSFGGVSAVPEPATTSLLLLAGASAITHRRRRNSRCC